jgi:hypothetical protein
MVHTNAVRSGNARVSARSRSISRNSTPCDDDGEQPTGEGEPIDAPDSPLIDEAVESSRFSCPTTHFLLR